MGKIFICCFVALSLANVLVLAADEHRPKAKEERGKRNLEYQISHHYSDLLDYRLQQPDRRISNGPPPPQYYPRPYRKDLHSEDLLTENNHVQDDTERKTYVHVKPKIIEKPVYIKEPEPIIEIIIKESNVSLPAPPPPPPPPKKKKEQVQVFFVKYKKNPHGVGKDAIIYDKPIPAISPKLPEDDEEEIIDEAPYSYHHETATLPPPPSTTLRTVIRPDSEVYHSPSGIKVTFGKEGFDYDKRASKPEDYVPQQPQPQSQPPQHHPPQGRQLSSFSNTYFKPPLTNPNFQSTPPGYKSDQQRHRQIARPASVSSPPSYKQFGRQTSPHFQQQVKFPSPAYTKTPYNQGPQQQIGAPPQQFSHTISHPPPARFQSSRPPSQQNRQPVPYKPFEFRPPQNEISQQPSHLPQHVHYRPEAYFPTQQQLPLPQPSHSFSQRFNPAPRPHQQQFNHQSQSSFSQSLPSHQQINFRPQHQINFHSSPATQQQRQPQQQQQQQRQQEQNHVQIQPAVNHHQQHQQQSQILQHHHQQARPIPHPLPLLQPAPNFHQDNIFNNRPPQDNQIHNVLPPGGELIQSVPKFEQHISSIEPAGIHQQPTYSPQQLQQKTIENFNSQEQDVLVQQNYLEQQRKYLEAKQRQRQHDELTQYFQQSRQNSQEKEIVITSPSPSTIYHVTRKAEYVTASPEVSYQSSTSRTSTTTTSTTTTTTEAATPSTTTKDPKELEAQLPDEVPEELRQQLLSSGILNNAQISILDYDKVGDIPLSALPADQLANFYSAGGAAQLAGSEPVPLFVDQQGAPVASKLVNREDYDLAEPEPEASEIQEVKVALPDVKQSSAPVDLKVVHYNPETDKGQQIQESYVQDEAKQVSPVVLNDESYTRYLPLKVNGSQFPIPDAPELKGKKISSVVVLAPVTYDFSSDRQGKDLKQPTEEELLEGDDLKKLISNPTLDNYKKFLETENKTKSDKQAVILLVADTEPSEDREIFMYDVGTQTVSKLSGELSSAFVEAAEANSKEEQASPSNIVETRLSYETGSKEQDSEQGEFESSDTKTGRT